MASADVLLERRLLLEPLSQDPKGTQFQRIQGLPARRSAGAEAEAQCIILSHVHQIIQLRFHKGEHPKQTNQQTQTIDRNYHQ